MSKYNVIVTAGGMSERIDMVRKITNSATGKLGVKITEELLRKEKINNIFYICSRESLKPDNPKVKIVEVDGVRDLKEKVTTLLQVEDIQIFIHSMAVSDYYVSYVTTPKKLNEEIVSNERKTLDILSNPSLTISGRKISSDEENVVLILKQAPKIISIIKDISPETYLVGFKLLDGVTKEELIEVASRLRDKNNCNLVVANDLNEIRQGHHHAYIIDIDDQIIEVSGKDEIAKGLVKNILK